MNRDSDYSHAADMLWDAIGSHDFCTNDGSCVNNCIEGIKEKKKKYYWNARHMISDMICKFKMQSVNDARRVDK